ncbi:MAG TPA: HypC/HybG/HupF family hydrogenase formation chaperone [Methanoregulaceae archaeon]|nr:HypC/HybG/HupF family hydrogenase formation chaperone [Methanoregulaceae archaeon]
MREPFGCILDSRPAGHGNDSFVFIDKRLDLVDVEVGEFVLVHVGFAIQKLSREEGFETREIFRQVFAAMEEEAEGQQTS